MGVEKVVERVVEMTVKVENLHIFLRFSWKGRIDSVEGRREV